MKKRLLAALVCVVLVLSLLPVTARADTIDYTLYFDSTNGTLKKNNASGEEYTGGGWSVNGNKLTLTNFHFTTSAAVGLSLPLDTELVLEGTNTVTVTTDSYNFIYGLSCSAAVTFSGDGTLIATASGTKSAGDHDYYGIWVKEGDLVVNGSCSITGRAGLNGQTAKLNNGIYVQDGNIVVNSGSITGKAGSAKTNSYGVFARKHSDGVYGKITVNGGSITGISGTAETASSGVYAYTTIEITNGTLIGVSEGMSSSAMNPYSYGIAVGNTQQINVESSATVLAKGYTSALSKAPMPTGVSAWASTSYDGSGAELYVSTNNNNYKYFRTLETIPALQLSVSQQPIFPYGQAPGNETVTIDSNLAGFNARNHFDSATMDGRPIDLGSVGAPGAHGSVRNGSIVIQLNKAYLDTLTVGTHTLRVNLTGVYIGQYVETQITVQPSGDGTGGAGNVPETGDSATPMLWLGLMLLAGAGLAVSVVRRKRRNG